MVPNLVIITTAQLHSNESEQGFTQVLILPATWISESCIKIKINTNFLYSHFFAVPEKALCRP